MTAPAKVPPLQGERRLLLLVLLGLAVAGWIVVIRQSVSMGGRGDMSMGGRGTSDVGGMDMGMSMEGVDLTMDMAAPVFLAMWVAMMVAMMFPASAPMIVAFSRAQARRRQDGRPFIPTWMFVTPYVAVWIVAGVVGYVLALIANDAIDERTWVADNMSRVAGGFVLAAGIYQLTPLKRMCLSRCRSPLSFMLSYWRDGKRGAVNMGLRHGLYCLGCCWVLFLLLFPIGIMNVAAMVAVAVLVLAEKALPHGEKVAFAAAAIMILYGLLAMAVPEALPTSVT